MAPMLLEERRCMGQRFVAALDPALTNVHTAGD